MMTVSERYIFLTKNWKKYRALKQNRQQPAGEEGLCPEPLADYPCFQTALIHKSL